VFELAREAGAHAFQFFISGERPWPELILREEFLDAFLNERMESKWNRDHIFVHGHLQINLASALEENLKRAERLFMSEIKGCEDLGIRNYILHPGSPKKKMDHQTAIKQVARLINAANKKHPTVKILIENMAGQGDMLGARFEELRDIHNSVEEKSKVGFCLDTQHLWAAGYDISKWSDILKEFDDIVGLHHLKCIHLNDSSSPYNSKIDSHASIGQGTIPIDVFRTIMKDTSIKNIPMILEVIHSEAKNCIQHNKSEILKLISFRDESRSDSC
jgi:apurinic endonuclease APN1